MDAYGQVNNVEVLRLLDETRSEIEYLRPLDYRREPVTIELWVGQLGGASIDVCYEVLSGGEPFARATTTVVLVDAATGAPRWMTAVERAAWLPYVEAPVELRRRRG
jgi:acyl-CoA thioester hydrolase